MNDLTTTIEQTQPLDPQATIARAQRIIALAEQATDAVGVRQAEIVLETIENLMSTAGLFQPNEIRLVHDGRIRARWKLGILLGKAERGGGRGKVSTGLKHLLASLGISAQTAMEIQRIGTLPEPKLVKALADYEREGALVSYDALVRLARPYWHKERRRERHETIVAQAEARQCDETIGPFPLIYADPPTPFETRSELGKERSAERHYPTMSWEAIRAFEVGGTHVSELAAPDAALFLWATSPNLVLSLDVMRAWGFDYKTHAVWDKGQIGTGYIFRNQHEVLLYGTRGEMPAPCISPASIIRAPRGKHSAKPPEIRSVIEKMFPDFDARTRLELFARDQVEGWTCRGFEAVK